LVNISSKPLWEFESVGYLDAVEPSWPDGNSYPCSATDFASSSVMTTSSCVPPDFSSSSPVCRWKMFLSDVPTSMVSRRTQAEPSLLSLLILPVDPTCHLRRLLQSPTAKSIPAIDEPEFLPLPGYSLPNPIYFIHGPLLKDHTGEYDFRRMENESLNAKIMTEHQLLVRKIVAEVLDIDPASMTAHSDFFLMGGTSANCAMAFANKLGSTLKSQTCLLKAPSGIASMITKIH